MRNAVGVDRDQADGALALERAEPLDHRAGRQPEPALPRHLDGDEVAVDRAGGRVGRDRKFAAELFLVDRHQPAAAARQAAKNAERAVLGAVDQLDDAAAGLRLRPACSMRMQRAVADAGDFAGLGAARRYDADDRRRAVRVLVPFGRPRQQLAVGVAAGDVGEHHRGQGAGMMQAFAPRSIWPSSASSRSMRLSAARSAFLAPKARAISRVPTLPLCSRMKASSSSREGEGVVS